MKTVTSTLRGLTSSLLLNAGFTQAAQKLDPVSMQPCNLSPEAHGPAVSYPCQFTRKALTK